MSYLVLARKWRPQNFSEVIGQETVTLTLKNAFKSGRLAHAYLLTGSRGVGKTTIARILAKSLVCENREDVEPCNICPQCTAVTDGSSLDIIEIDGASHTSVDDIRTLRDGARFLPTSARLKVFIIDEVHMLSTSAFNALLKILEEPPAHVKFIFATTEAQKIPVTILSRCQRFDFGRVPHAAIVAHMQKILSAEKLSVPLPSLDLIAKAAQGGMRDALSLLDQVICFSGGSPTHEDVVRILGFTPRSQVLKIVQAILKAQTQEAIAALTEANSSGHDVSLLMGEITLELRHLLLAKVVGAAKADLAELSADELASIFACAQEYEEADLQRLFALALDSINSVAKASYPILAAELAIIKMARRPALYEMQSINDAICRLEQLQGKIPPASFEKGEVKISPPPLPKNPLSPLKKVEEVPLPPVKRVEAPTFKDINSSWLEFVGLVGQNHLMQATHLEHGNFLSANTTEVLVEFHHRVHFQEISENASLLLPFLRQCFGEQVNLKTLLKPVAEAVHVPNISNAREEEVRLKMAALSKRALADPLVQKAVQLFGGEVVSVTESQ